MWETIVEAQGKADSSLVWSASLFGTQGMRLQCLRFWPFRAVCGGWRGLEGVYVLVAGRKQSHAAHLDTYGNRFVKRRGRGDHSGSCWGVARSVVGCFSRRPVFFMCGDGPGGLG
jgi:hypothetical protein